jgi:hypothetical protein
MINKITPKVIPAVKNADQELAEISQKYFRRDYIISDAVLKNTKEKVVPPVEFFNPRAGYVEKEIPEQKINFIF